MVIWALMAVLTSVVVFALALLLLYLTDGLSEQSPVGAVIAGLVTFPVSFVVIAAISVRRAEQRRLGLLHGRAVRGRP
jgi:hypothetical protein